MSQNQIGTKLVSKLLGLTQDEVALGNGAAQGHLLRGQVQATQQAPAQNQQPTGWNGALQSLKLSDALQGINVTPNFLFLLLFLGFTAWLGVVYWIRHHEPLANSVLGTGAAQSATAAADRQLVAGIRKTLPVRTSPTTGEFYVPIPHGNQIIHSGAFANPAAAAAYATPPQSTIPMPSPPIPPQPTPEPQPTPLQQYPYSIGNAYMQQPYVQPAMTPHAYMVPVQQSAGTRVKMIVNR